MATLADMIADARHQYHLLITGQQAVVAVHGPSGERIEFRPASAPKLAAYIRDLERQMAGRSRPAELKTRTSKGLES